MAEVPASPKEPLTACYSLISFAHGSGRRSRCVLKSTRMATSSSTPVTLPRPYLSWVTKSPTAKVSTGLSAIGTLKGLPGKERLARPAREGFTSPVCPLSARHAWRVPASLRATAYATATATVISVTVRDIRSSSFARLA